MPERAKERGGGPALSVVVCTDGGGTVAEAVDSIRSSAVRAGREVELVVPWQGDGPAPEVDGANVIDVFPIGLSYARNRGLEATVAPLVAFVDDDEVVDPAWAGGVLDALTGEDRLDAAFGPIEPLDDRGLPFSFGDGAFRVFAGSGTPPWIVGTGGNMAFRREALEAVGGFDLRFGVNAPAHSAEETDVIMRLLAAGRRLAFAPGMPVYHPTKTEHESLASRSPYGFGMGAALRRHRAGPHVARYLVTIGQAAGTALRTRDRRQLREAGATFRSFAAGVVSPLRAVSPARALRWMPEPLEPFLDGTRPEPLEATLGSRPHLRYAAGPGRTLHVHVNPDGEDTGESEVIARAAGRDSVWLVEERRERR